MASRMLTGAPAEKRPETARSDSEDDQAWGFGDEALVGFEHDAVDAPCAPTRRSFGTQTEPLPTLGRISPTLLSTGLRLAASYQSSPPDIAATLTKILAEPIPKTEQWPTLCTALAVLQTEERLGRFHSALARLVFRQILDSIDMPALTAATEDVISQELLVDPVVLRCGHSFTKTHVETWLADHATCPLCRAPQTPGAPLTANQQLRAVVEALETDNLRIQILGAALRLSLLDPSDDGKQAVAFLLCTVEPEAAQNLHLAAATRDVLARLKADEGPSATYTGEATPIGLLLQLRETPPALDDVDPRSVAQLLRAIPSDAIRSAGHLDVEWLRLALLMPRITGNLGVLEAGSYLLEVMAWDDELNQRVDVMEAFATLLEDSFNDDLEDRTDAFLLAAHATKSITSVSEWSAAAALRAVLVDPVCLFDATGLNTIACTTIVDLLVRAAAGQMAALFEAIGPHLGAPVPFEAGVTADALAPDALKTRLSGLFLALGAIHAEGDAARLRQSLLGHPLLLATFALDVGQPAFLMAVLSLARRPEGRPLKPALTKALRPGAPAWLSASEPDVEAARRSLRKLVGRKLSRPAPPRPEALTEDVTDSV